MKAILKSTTITAILAFLFTVNVMAETNFPNESYIDDIPFDTEIIYSQIVIERNILDFKMDEEAYINDIPFQTKAISEDKLYALALEVDFSLKEESYIDDIPFNTKEISNNLITNDSKDIVNNDYAETIYNSMPEEEIELKYFEQHSHTIVRF